LRLYEIDLVLLPRIMAMPGITGIPEIPDNLITGIFICVKFDLMKSLEAKLLLKARQVGEEEVRVHFVARWNTRDRI
jgi:hypothetical protein